MEAWQDKTRTGTRRTHCDERARHRRAAHSQSGTERGRRSVCANQLCQGQRAVVETDVLRATIDAMAATCASCSCWSTARRKTISGSSRCLKTVRQVLIWRRAAWWGKACRRTAARFS